MICCASYAAWTARSTCLAALLVIGLAGCARSKPPPLLRQERPARAAAPAEQATTPVAYRTLGGEPIAPVVIADDPPPTQLVPTEHQAPARNTLNGDPGGLTRETLNHSISNAMPSLAACFSPSAEDPMVAISFEASPGGRPSLVRINGAPGDAEHCIRNVVQNLRFPPFEGKGVQVDVPLSFHRVARSVQSAPPSAEEQAGAAPALFLQP